jgi:hypothetical protein
MSKDHGDVTIWVENLLAALVSLQVFTAEFHFDGNRPAMGYLQYITKISDRAPQLEYIGVYHRNKSYYGKRVGGEWVLCDKESFVDSTSRTS